MIQLDSGELGGMNEALLLDLFRLLYHVKYPFDDAIGEVAKVCCCAPNTLRAALENRTYIGVLSWIRLEKKLGTGLFHSWYELQRKMK